MDTSSGRIKLTGTAPLDYTDLVNLGSDSSFMVGGKMKL